MQGQALASIAAVAMTICLFSTHALGAEDRGFYAGIGVGKATSRATARAGGDDFEDDDVSYRLLAGYALLRYLALELDYIDGGTAADSIGPYELELNPSTATAWVVGTLPLGRWDLSAKLGYAFHRSEQQIRLGSLVETSSNSDEDFAGGLAVTFNFNERYSVRAEFEGIVMTGGHFHNTSLVGIFRF